jgi:hypothetical protein
MKPMAVWLDKDVLFCLAEVPVPESSRSSDFISVLDGAEEQTIEYLLEDFRKISGGESRRIDLAMLGPS